MKTTVNKDIFAFLQQQHLNVLYDLAKSAHKYMYTDPNTALINIWKYSDAILKYIYQTEGIPFPEEGTQTEKLEYLLTNGVIHSKIFRILNYTTKKGSKAVQEPNYGSIEDAKTSLKCAFYLGVWLNQIYGSRLMGISMYMDPFLNLTRLNAADQVKEEENSLATEVSVITFSNDELGYEEWLGENPIGFVFNHFGGGEGSKTMNKIHRADCRYLVRRQDEGKRTTAYEKVCSTSLEKLEEHVRRLRENSWVNCKTCMKNE